MASSRQVKHSPEPTQHSKPTTYLTSWCGGMGCDNCKLCLIFSGKAELIKADDKNLKLTYRIKENVL